MPTTPLFPLPEGLEMTDVQRDSRRSRGMCDLTALQFTLPTVFDVFICYPQLLPKAPSGSAMYWSSYPVDLEHSKVLLS